MSVLSRTSQAARGAVRREPLILLAASGGQLIVTTILYVAPVVIDALIARGFAPDTAGFLLSIEMMAAAAVTVLVSLWPKPYSRRKLAILGAVLSLFGQALSLYTPSYFMLFVGRLLAGVGEGVVSAQITAVAARSHRRERMFSLMMIVGVINGSVWLGLIPYTVPVLGYRGPYLCLFAISMLGALGLLRMPSPPFRRHASHQTAPNYGITIAGMVLAAVFLTQVGQGSFWTLVGMLGVHSGLPETQVAGFLSFANVLLLLGVSGTAWAGARYGRYGPLFVLTSVNAASIAVIALVPNETVYFAANVVQAVTNISSVVYQLGIAAQIDRSGRLPAMAMGLLTLGIGVGPSAAGLLTTHYGAASVGPFALVLNLVALGLYGVVGLRMRAISGGMGA